MSSQTSININTKGHTDPVIVTTQPDLILRHSISDEELDMLCESKSELVIEMLLIAIGGAVAVSPSVVANIFSYLTTLEDKSQILTLLDFIQIIIFFSCVFVGICLGVVFRRKSRRGLSLREQIRARSNKATK